MNAHTTDENWILIPPSGNLAIYRHPLPVIPENGQVASGTELLAANRGNPFPWGHLPEPHPHNRQWREHKVGTGGLIHSAWFLTTEGRFGGAPNVPETKPGSLRSCLYLDGGGLSDSDNLAENEGYAIVRKTKGEDKELFRKVTLFSAAHVMADGGAIIMSPLCSDGTVRVGFVGRCQICPNAELISFSQLKKSVSGYNFQLWPEWKNWSVGPSAEQKSEAPSAFAQINKASSKEAA